MRAGILPASGKVCSYYSDSQMNGQVAGIFLPLRAQRASKKKYRNLSVPSVVKNYCLPAHSIEMRCDISRYEKNAGILACISRGETWQTEL